MAIGQAVVDLFDDALTIYQDGGGQGEDAVLAGTFQVGVGINFLKKDAAAIPLVYLFQKNGLGMAWSTGVTAKIEESGLGQGRGRARRFLPMNPLKHLESQPGQDEDGEGEDETFEHLVTRGNSKMVNG